MTDNGVYGDDEDCAYEEANDESDEDVDDAWVETYIPCSFSKTWLKF